MIRYYLSLMLIAVRMQLHRRSQERMGDCFLLNLGEGQGKKFLYDPGLGGLTLKKLCFISTKTYHPDELLQFQLQTNPKHGRVTCHATVLYSF